jgi:tetratricopeptide (TPR) repeat protein
MKQFLVIVLIASCAGLFACSRKPANTDNANAQAESPFANITDANAALAEGDRLMDENDTNMAIEAYKQAIKLNPDFAEAHFKLGIAYGLMEMQMEPEGHVADTLDSKGRTHSEKSFERAVEAYKKWLDANPDDDVAHYNLGRTYNKLNKDDEAEREFRQAVKLKPEDTEYQTELGNILIKLAKYREAIGPLKKAVEIDPTNERAASLLEDAEAGRQRIDYVGKNTNSNANANRNANANANVNANSAGNTNTMVRPSNTNTKPSIKPTPAAERPRQVRPN